MPLKGHLLIYPGIYRNTRREGPGILHSNGKKGNPHTKQKLLEKLGNEGWVRCPGFEKNGDILEKHYLVNPNAK